MVRVRWEISKDGVYNCSRMRTHVFDSVFDCDANTETLFSTFVQPLLLSCMRDGTDLSFLCFGESGTGKTHTLFGTKDEAGVVQSTLEAVFAYIETTAGKDFVVRAGFFEIFNESVNDLMCPGKNDLAVAGNAQVEGLTEMLCADSATCIRRVREIKPEKRKHSELVFRLVVESKERESDSVAVTTISLIKLSASDFLSEEADEVATTFHKSVNELNTVVQRLARKQGESVSFEGSKLTKYLQRSLEGSSKVALLCTMSPAATSYDKTTSTFCFAMRARNISLSPKKNLVSNPSESLLLQCSGIQDVDKKKEIEKSIVAGDKLNAIDCFVENTEGDISDELEEKIKSSFELQKRIKELYKKSNNLPNNPEVNRISAEEIWRADAGDLLTPSEAKEPLEALKETLAASERSYFKELEKEYAGQIKVSVE